MPPPNLISSHSLLQVLWVPLCLHFQVLRPLLAGLAEERGRLVTLLLGRIGGNAMHDETAIHLLSFAPSAAARGHGARMRTTREGDSVRRNVLYSVGLCLRLSHQKCVRNTTECSPFFGTVPPIVSQKMCKKQDEMPAFFLFLVDVGVIFPPGGTPGGSRPPSGAQVES